MSTKELNAQLAELVQKAYGALHEAETFADEHKLNFSFKPAYGMGGWYEGNEEERYGDALEGGWNPSSQGC